MLAGRGDGRFDALSPHGGDSFGIEDGERHDR
jgi:hypothetical protein